MLWSGVFYLSTYRHTVHVSHVNNCEKVKAAIKNHKLCGHYWMILWMFVRHFVILAEHWASSAKLLQKHTYYLDPLVSLPHSRQGRANRIQPGRAGYLLPEGFDPLCVVCFWHSEREKWLIQRGSGGGIGRIQLWNTWPWTCGRRYKNTEWESGELATEINC